MGVKRVTAGGRNEGLPTKGAKDSKISVAFVPFFSDQPNRWSPTSRIIWRISIVFSSMSLLRSRALALRFSNCKSSA